MKTRFRRMGANWLTFVLPEELTSEPHRPDVHQLLGAPIRIVGVVHVVVATVIGLHVARHTLRPVFGSSLAPLVDDRDDEPSLLLALMIVFLLWGIYVLVAARTLRLFAARRARRMLRLDEPMAGTTAIDATNSVVADVPPEALSESARSWAD